MVQRLSSGTGSGSAWGQNALPETEFKPFREWIRFEPLDQHLDNKKKPGSGSACNGLGLANAGNK